VRLKRITEAYYQAPRIYKIRQILNGQRQDWKRG